MNEAFKCLTKAKMKNESLQEEKLGEIKNKMTLIKKFVTARRFVVYMFHVQKSFSNIIIPEWQVNR